MSIEVVITEVEIRVFERWFADFFDELFGPQPAEKGVTPSSAPDGKEP